MVMSGWSVHLTTLFSWASLSKQLTSTSRTDNNRSWISVREENGRRNYFMKVCDWTWIKLATLRSAVGHVTDCAMWPNIFGEVLIHTINWNDCIIIVLCIVWPIKKIKMYFFVKILPVLTLIPANILLSAFYFCCIYSFKCISDYILKWKETLWTLFRLVPWE